MPPAFEDEGGKQRKSGDTPSTEDPEPSMDKSPEFIAHWIHQAIWYIEKGHSKSGDCIERMRKSLDNLPDDITEEQLGLITLELNKVSDAFVGVDLWHIAQQVTQLRDDFSDRIRKVSKPDLRAG